MRVMVRERASIGTRRCTRTSTMALITLDLALTLITLTLTLYICTMEWWDNLWLNEGFATWMQNWAASQLHPDWRMWDQFALGASARGSVRCGSSSYPSEGAKRRQLDRGPVGVSASQTAACRFFREAVEPGSSLSAYAKS